MALPPTLMLRADVNRFKFLLVCSNIFFGAIIVLAAALAAESSYDAHQARAREASIRMVQGLSQDISESLSQVDHTLQSTLLQVGRISANRPLSLNELLTISEEQRALVPSMTSLGFTDANGLELFSASEINVGGLDYFRAARDQPTSPAVSGPLAGRISNTGWSMILARAWLSAEGDFKGIIYGGITTDKFHERLKRASVGLRGAVSLRTADLKLVSRYTPGVLDKSAAIGTTVVSKKLRNAIAANAIHGSVLTHTALDGIERINAYQKLPAYPMILVVGLATEDFLQPWWRQLWIICFFAFSLELLALCFSFVIFRAHRRQQQDGEQIAKLAFERGVLLDNDLVGMTKFRSRHEVWHNRAFANMFGYKQGELSGTSSRQLYRDDASYACIGDAYANLASGKTFRAQLQMVKKDGSSIWIELSGAALEGGESLWIMVDIDAVKSNEQQARHLALHDALTGLPNRHLLQQRLEFLLYQAGQRQSQVVVCYLDIDGFKAVNDIHGHDAGDELLRMAASRMGGSIRADDVVSRIGGDEFILLINQLNIAEETENALDRLIDAFQLPFALSDGTEVYVGASIGVALFPQHAGTVAELITFADQAMLKGKRTGKGRWVMHGSSIS